MAVINDDFLVWCEKMEEEMKHVLQLLGERLSDQPEELIQDLLAIEAWNGRCQFILAEANTYLDKARFAYKPPKEAGTEMDRRLILDDSVATYRLIRDKAEGLVEAIKQRLSLGQSILAYQRQFIERGNKPDPNQQKVPPLQDIKPW